MVSSVVKKYAALCMVCLCSSLFFLGLYQFNNKYSQNTIQAANGILALSEEELQKSPVRFLVSGWAFYPDALLTPEEIQDESHYMRYLSIGEQTNFSSPANPSPYGCGTYQMTFFLPDAGGQYNQRNPVCILPVWLYSYLCLCAAVLLFQPPDETEKYIPVRTDLPCHVRPVILSCASYAGCGSRIPLVHDGTVLYLSGYLADRSSAKSDMQAGLPACGHQ